MKQYLLLVGKIAIVGFICHHFIAADYRFCVFIVASGIIGYKYIND